MSVVLGSIASFMYVFFPAALERQAVDSLRDRAESVGAMASFAVRSALVFNDEAAMEEALRGTLTDPDVLHVELIDGLGRSRASIGPVRPGLADAGTDPDPFVAGTAPDGSTFASATPVTFNGSTVGEVQLLLSLEETRAQADRTRGMIGLVSTTVFGLGLLAVLLVGAQVTGPLRAIAQTSERIADGDLSQRVAVSSRDEVGQLASSFNRMVDRVERAQVDLVSANAQLEQILDHVPAEVALFDLDYRFLYVNPVCAEDREERAWVIGQSMEALWHRRGAAPEVAAECMVAMRRCLDEADIVTFEQHVKLPEQERYYLRAYAPIPDSDGTVSKIIGYAVDVSERRLAEAALKDSEERLRQSQKLESIGRLAGGVAHDFNNLLTAILGHAEFLSADMEPGDPRLEDVEEIQKNSQRAAALTRQLLAFSRKQVLQPRIIDLNDVVTGVETMLGRLLGEDLEVQTRLAAMPNSVMADPGQIEQVIVNLAVNARDAMPDGGLLLIETGQYEVRGELVGADPQLDEGWYTTLTISDTGVGMDPETTSQIFEPFFTTKGPAEGTGLGLSTVHGIVEQSGGAIHVYSELGLGTTFRIYLPMANEHPETKSLGQSEGAGGHETVLIAEDQESVLRLTCRILERFGYTVLAASGPEAALEIAAEHNGPIDLLLTDVVMPKMSGRQLAEKLTAIRPETSVLYMSGYSDDALSYHGVLDEGIVLLEKPFTADELGAAVRGRLAGKSVRLGEDVRPAA